MKVSKSVWLSIQAEYETEGASHKSLAKKYGVSVKSIEYHSGKEKWHLGRHEYEGSLRVHTASRVRERMADRASKKAADEIDLGLEASELILQIAVDALRDPDQFRRHHFKRSERDGHSSREWVEEGLTRIVDAKRLADLSSAISRADTLLRSIKGVLNPVESERMEMERQRFEIDKRKNGPDIDSEQETGIALMPETYWAALDNALPDPNQINVDEGIALEA